MDRFLTFEKYLKEQEDYTDESGVLYNESENYDNNEWLFTLDLSKLWKQYQDTTIKTKKFNEYYAKFLYSNKDILIGNVGLDCWTDLEPIIFKMKNESNKEESENRYDELYDVYDRHLIYLKI